LRVYPPQTGLADAGVFDGIPAKGSWHSLAGAVIQELDFLRQNPGKKGGRPL